MKKRIQVCFLVFTMSIFYFLISNVVFGASPTEQVIRNYESTLLSDEVRPLLPNFLNVFKGSEFQKAMLPHHVGVLLDKPIFLRTLVPKTDNRFIALLYIDGDFRTLFGDEQFYNVLKDSGEINKLLEWFKKQPSPPPPPPPPPPPLPPRPTTLNIVLGAGQSDEVGKPLEPFVVGVLDQAGKPLQGTAVTFAVTAGNGRLSKTMDTTNEYGQARTILTLGSRAEDHSVVARAAGIAQPQTFTATAIPSEDDEEDSEEPPMYWIAGNTIYHRSTGGGNEPFHAPQSGTFLTGGLAVDMGGRKVYWTERTIDNMGRIQSADLDDSTNVKTVNETIAVPFDIAFDATERSLYWTNSFGKIQSINVDRKDFRGDFITPEKFPTMKEPMHIAFDMTTRRLHWTEMDADGIWSIYSTFVDHVDQGTAGRIRLDKEDLGQVKGIAVAGDVVYWTEQTSSGGTVRFVNRTGLGDKKLLGVLEESIPEGIAVDPVGGKVYWTTSRGEIQSVPLAIETVVMGGAEGATGIALGGTARGSVSPGAPSLSSVGSVENTLLANYPNPFNPETWIPYQLSASADVSVSIYAVDGRLVRRLDLGHQVAGVYRSRSRAAYWDGRNEFGERVASGLYFYTLTAGDFTATRKMLIRK